MPRFLFGLCMGSALVAFACNDETVESVPEDVCYSKMRWIGDKRGSPEMFPGEDCVGCHLENDGPQLALGGTLYPFVIGSKEQYEAAQSGEHCFGVAGITVTVEDGEGQLFELVTNRAGNFFIEGNPDDFAKPFSVQIEGYQVNAQGTPANTQMITRPMYGGCGRCHNPAVPPAEMFLSLPDDPEYRNGQPFIGLPGYYANGLDNLTVNQELDAIACEKTGTLGCPPPPRN